MIRIVTNNLESGDWIVVEDEIGEVWSGHRVGVEDLKEILTTILKDSGTKVTMLSVTDEELEEGNY